MPNSFTLLGMKKAVYTLLILVLIGLFIFFGAGAKIVDGQMNILEKLDHGDIPAAVADLHDSLVIADWHADNLLWDRNLLTELSHGHVDVPRLIKGNVTLQVFDAVIKTPKNQNYDRNSDDTDNITMLTMANRWPIRTWNSLCERALYQSEKLHGAAKVSEGKLRIIKTQRDLTALLKARAQDKEMVGGVLAIEGLHALEGKSITGSGWTAYPPLSSPPKPHQINPALENLQRLYDAGFRVMGLTHFFDNEIGGSSAGVNQGGLTPLGRVVISKMNELNITIDLAHASSALISDVLSLTDKPVVVSHTGVKGTYESPRNLSDDQLKTIASNGGVIGIGFWNGAVGSSSPSDIVKAMRYTVDLIGIDHVCLGSDWDGGTSVYFDAANIWVLTQELMKSGFSNQEIYKIMGGNQIEFLKRNLPL